MTASHTIELDDRDRALASGEAGKAMQLAMDLVVTAARVLRAKALIPVTFAHIDACFYNGQAHIDFARYLLDHGAKLAVPAWTNNGPVSLEQPGIHDDHEAAEFAANARQLMRLYIELGCRPVWTCAPYQLPDQPCLGDHIVAGESNAVAYYNSVLGARTNKYGDFLDVACALTGKAPLAGLHTDEGRRGKLLFRTDSIPDRFKSEAIFYHLLGFHIGRVAGSRVPVIDGLPATVSLDDQKAVSAAVAAAGGVTLWHGIGLTPEAPDMETAFGGIEPEEVVPVSVADLIAARDELSSGRDGPVEMVALGTPHFSYTEFAALMPLLAGRRVKENVKLYISTSRFVRDLAAQQGWIAELERAGATVITDTCTYFSPAVRGCKGRVMTNAAKWAYYAPGMLGVECCFGSLNECAETAVNGSVWRDPALWKDLAA